MRRHHMVRMKLAELDGEHWFDENESLTTQEKALLDARLPAYAKNPDAGRSWGKVETRIRAGLTRATELINDHFDRRR